MPQKKLTLGQAASLLYDYRHGVRPRDLPRKYGITTTALYQWVPYAGLDAEWLVKVKALEHQLLLARRHRDEFKEDLKHASFVIKKFQPSPKRRSVLTTALRATYRLNRRRANAIMGVCENAGENPKVCREDAKLIALMRDYFADNPGQGLNTLFRILLRDRPCTRERALELYKQGQFALKHRARPAPLPRRVLKPMKIQTRPNQVWSMDFMLDVLPNGKRFRLLNIVDDFNREAIVLRVTKSNTAKLVCEVLCEVFAQGRIPERIRTDNGGEFHSATYQKMMSRHGVKPIYSRPSKPTDNAYIESFNKSVRAEVLGRFAFRNTAQVQRMLEDWRIRYNAARPQKALGWLSPLQYAHSRGVEKDGRVVTRASSRGT